MTRMNWEGAKRRDRFAGLTERDRRQRRQNKSPARLVNSKLVTQALRNARRYDGDFGFMLDMRQRAADPNWVPSDREVRAILRCTTPKPGQAREAAPKPG